VTIIKNAARKALAVLGYELRRSTTRSVRFENFANLAAAYEQRLDDRGDSISPNEIRPQLLARLLGTPPSEAYFIVQALSRCRDLPGDVCEFGVAQGETSALIANEIVPYSDKRLHLFDSFKGLPDPTAKDQLVDDIFQLGSMRAYAGRMSFPEDMVRGRLDAISFPAQRYVIHRGFIERVIREDTALPKEVCFAYVDFDFYEPIKVALGFLDRVIPSGATVIVDDYGFFSAGVRTAVDEFVEAKRSVGIAYECIVPNIRYGHFAVLTKKGQ
jgi:O-methyltransferase